LRLDAHDTATPLALVVDVVVELSAEVLAQGLELGLVLLLDGSDGAARGGLLVDDGTQSALALDDAVRDILLAAQSGQPADQLNGVDIVRDDDELGLLRLDELDNVVHTRLDEVGLLGRVLATGDLILGHRLKSDFLLGLGFGLVAGHQTEQLRRLVLVHGVVELVQRRGDLQAHEKNSLLALEADVAGPADITGQVTLRLNVTTDGEVLGLLLEQRVGGNLLVGLGSQGGLGQGLLAFLVLRRHLGGIEKNEIRLRCLP